MNYILLSVLVLGLANLDPATSGSNLFAKSALINAQPAQLKTDTGLPASNCVKDDLPCELDLSAFQVISELHSQLDDDKDGGVDPTEAAGFLREELRYGSGSPDRSNRFSRNDQHVSVTELWQRWKTSSVYNWTTDDVINWLETHVELPHLKEVFIRQKIDGPALPKLAMSTGSYLTNVLHVRNPVHRQKIIVKAIDAILFGAPRVAHNYVKDGILVALLCVSLGGCWFAFVQYKKSQANLANMTQELDALTRKEESLIAVTKKLVEAERRQELDLQEKTSLEEKYRKEVEEARAETNRLACERQSKAQLVEQLEMTEKELDSVKQLLAEAERKLRTGEGAMEGLGESGGMLQTLLQLTYETEVGYHNVKRREAELQLVQARDNCEKVRRKRAAFMGSLRIAHSTTLDDVDRSITEAKSALEAVKQDLQERQFRWTQIELITGLPLINNPGLDHLRKTFLSARDSGILDRSAARNSKTPSFSAVATAVASVVAPRLSDDSSPSTPSDLQPCGDVAEVAQPRPTFTVEDTSSQSSEDSSPPTMFAARSKSSDELASEQNDRPAMPRSQSHNKVLQPSKANHKPSNPLKSLLRRKRPDVA